MYAYTTLFSPSHHIAEMGALPGYNHLCKKAGMVVSYEERVERSLPLVIGKKAIKRVMGNGWHKIADFMVVL